MCRALPPRNRPAATRAAAAQRMASSETGKEASAGMHLRGTAPLPPPLPLPLPPLLPMPLSPLPPPPIPPPSSDSPTYPSSPSPPLSPLSALARRMRPSRLRWRFSCGSECGSASAGGCCGSITGKVVQDVHTSLETMGERGQLPLVHEQQSYTHRVVKVG